MSFVDVISFDHDCNHRPCIRQEVVNWKTPEVAQKSMSMVKSLEICLTVSGSLQQEVIFVNCTPIYKNISSKDQQKAKLLV